MKEDKILDEITTFCETCASRESCPEEDCVLYRIEKVVVDDNKKVYQVEITETAQRVVKIEAINEEEAINIVDQQYRDGDIVMEYNDYKGYDVNIFKGDNDDEV